MSCQASVLCKVLYALTARMCGLKCAKELKQLQNQQPLLMIVRLKQICKRFTPLQLTTLLAMKLASELLLMDLVATVKKIYHVHRVRTFLTFCSRNQELSGFLALSVKKMKHYTQVLMTLMILVWQLVVFSGLD